MVILITPIHGDTENISAYVSITSTAADNSPADKAIAGSVPNGMTRRLIAV